MDHIPVREKNTVAMHIGNQCFCKHCIYMQFSFLQHFLPVYTSIVYASSVYASSAYVRTPVVYTPVVCSPVVFIHSRNNSMTYWEWYSSSM